MSPILANVIVDLFHKGGPIMYPLLVAAIIAIAVVGERVLWWVKHTAQRDAATVAKILEAAEHGAWNEATQLAENSQDPVAKVLAAGLEHRETSLEGAIQVASGRELREAARFIPTLDTLVTLAPLLGLLGTVTGIMSSFNSIGNDELSVVHVTGGIGEALIATAAGLGIAITTLIPLNTLTTRLAGLQSDIEAAATTLQVAAHQHEARSKK
jgi:biopolymer transport protein ExbB